ncbi:MAG: DNA-directed RNA polymerase subunit alpha [bacterium]|nr:DNA-directed RNA polymerase subunit alpha [bacterium]
MQTILLPESPKVVKKSPMHAVIEIAACYPGYGMTIGNALRRVLLSSLPGAAITAVKVKGVPHEFVTIPGVMENATLIALNLKQVRFKMFSEGPVRVTLSKKGPGKVVAGDIQVTSDMEVANPDLHLATLTSSDSSIEMELEVERGLGYVPVEEHRREKVEVGLIALDATFSPIRRVTYDVANMRVGDRTDFNRITFNIETDGTMAPEEAFSRSVQILVEQFDRLKELHTEGAEAMPAESAVHSVEAASETMDTDAVGEADGGSIGDMGLKTRIANILEEGGMKTVADIAAKTEEELLGLEGLGDKAVKDIKKVIGRKGFTLTEKQ